MHADKTVPGEPSVVSAGASLSGKVIRGSLWIISLRSLNAGMGVVRKIILARLLAPEDFGLFGIALLAVVTLETFSQTGIQQIIIQKDRDASSLLDTAWTVSACRGIVIFFLLWISAPLVAAFFDTPRAVWILRIIGLQPLFRGFTNIGIIYFQKDLEFRKQVLYELSVALTHLGVALSLAFILRDAWALVWGGLTAGCLRALLSYAVHDYRPRLCLDKEQLKEILRFGKWILASGILVYFNTQGDDLFVGKVLGVSALGLYQLAYVISNVSATEFTRMISHVTFPAYSKIRRDLCRLREAYLRVSKINAAISLPLAGGIFVLCPEFNSLFLGPKWMAMTSTLQALSVWGCMRSIGASTGPVFYSMGRPEAATRLQALQLVLLILCIYPLSVKMGILGTALAVICAAFPANLLAVFYVLKLLESGPGRFCTDAVIPLVSTIGSAVLLAGLKAADIFELSIPVFILYVFLYLSTYLIILATISRFTGYRLGYLMRTIKAEIG